MKACPCRSIISLFSLCSVGLVGCGQPYAAPKEFSNVAQTMVGIAGDQMVADLIKSKLSGNIHDPGMEGYVNVRVSAGGRVVGVDGDIDLDVDGTGTQLPANVRKLYIERLAALTGLNNPTEAQQEEIRGLMSALEWNRTESPHNPVP